MRLNNPDITNADRSWLEAVGLQSRRGLLRCLKGDLEIALSSCGTTDYRNVWAQCIQQNGAHLFKCAPIKLRNAAYFLTISAFSSIATPPRSAILPLTVIVLPAYSAS